MKKVFAGVSAFLVAFVGIANAMSFQDVSADAWYASYVQNLVDQGVIDDGASYRPAATLNRAELTKIAIEAAGIEIDTVGAPTFSDVASDAWYYNYVATAAKKGIVGGYTDANGKSTGKFGPSDAVTRAAATKILVNAFGVALDLEPASTFSDVQDSSAWYYDYVVTGYNQSIVDGYSDGSFRPAATINRAEIAKITVAAQNPVERQTNGGDTDGGDTDGGDTDGGSDVPTVSDGSLAVQLSSTTPASTVYPMGAVGTVVASYDLTASAAGDVTVSEVTVSRQGVGSRTDFDALYLYNGETKISGSRTISSETNTAVFTNLKLTVPAGETVTLNLVADIALGAKASNEHYFQIALASDLTSNAKAVTGNFPVASNKVVIGGSQVSTATISRNGTLADITIGGTSAEVAKFQVAAGSNNLSIEKFVLNQKGSTSSKNLSNVKLYQGATEVASTVTMDGDYFTFLLTTPFVMTNGTNRTFTVKADLIGGRNAETVIMSFENRGDFQAIDQVLGSNVYTTYTPVAPATATDTLDLAIATIKGGDITVSFTGPQAKDVSKGATGVDLWTGNLTSQADVTFKDTYINIHSTNALGLCSAQNGTVYLKNVKLVRTDTGATLVGPQDVNTSAVANCQDYTFSFGDDFEMTTGQTLPIAIRADLAQSINTTSNVITATLNIASWAGKIKRNDSSDYITSIIPSSNISGNALTVKAPSLSAAVAANPTAKTVVKGAKKESMLGFNLAAGTNGDVTITSIKLPFTSTGAGTMKPQDVAQTLYLYDGETLVSTKSPRSTTSATQDDVTFDSLNYVVAAGKTVTLTVKADINTSLDSNYSVVFGLPTFDGRGVITDITAEDKDGNTVTPTLTGAAAGYTMTVNQTGGSIVASVDANTPTSSLILMDQTKVEAYRAKFNADVENFRIERLTFRDTTSKDNNVKQVYLEYPNSATDTASTATVTGTLSSGVVTFDLTSAPMYALDDKDARVKLYVDTQSKANGAVSGDAVRFALDAADFKAYGLSSQAMTTTLASSFAAVSGAPTFVGGEAADAVTVTVTSAANIVVGDLLKVGANGEQMTVTSIAGAVLTVVRGVNGTTAAVVPAAAVNKATIGNSFTVARATAVFSVASSSASGSRTVSSTDNVASFTLTNGGDTTATLSSVKVTVAGSLIDSTVAGPTTVAVKVYNDASLNDANLVGSGNLSIALGVVTAVNITPFSPAVEVSAKSTKTLYFVVDTSAAPFKLTSSDDLFTLTVVDYAWNDGSVTFTTNTAVTAGTLAPGLTRNINANTLRY